MFMSVLVYPLCTHKSTRIEVAVDSVIILFGVLSWHGLEVWCLCLGLSVEGWYLGLGLGGWCLVNIPAEDKWAKTLTFLGHVTSSVTWPLDSPYPISYWCSIVTKPLTPALLEILGPKHNWVTTLTFLDHVTSSITWALVSTYHISYWCSIEFPLNMSFNFYSRFWLQGI